MKTLIALLMTVCVGLFIVGCGEGDTGGGADGAPVGEGDEAEQAEMEKAMAGDKDMPGGAVEGFKQGEDEAGKADKAGGKPFEPTLDLDKGGDKKKDKKE